MTFVNEYIPDDDYKKFDIDGLNSRPRKKSGTTPASSWTIDRDRKIWLRKYYAEMDHTDPSGGFTGVSAWDFYWKGALMLVEIISVEEGGGYGKPRWARSKLKSINLPESLEANRLEVIKDLEAALCAYKGSGVFANQNEEYSFELDF